ncbi:MAG: Ig-like domain-containing protein, partial [Vicinamibacterales bacterium]
MSFRVILVFVIAAAVAAGCSVEKETILAPTDAFMTLRSDAQFVPANATATISAELKKIDGTPAPDGTEIVIQATAGTLDQQKLRVKNGTATATFRAGATTGTVRITASSGAINAELSLRVGSAPPGNLSIVPAATVLPSGGGETDIIATVSSPTGALVVGAPVSFSTTSGTVSADDVTTNDRGEARTTLRTSATATVSASVLGLSASTTVRVRIPAV